jgi:RNA polymerase sigma-70 factor (ECF subfamily)
LSPSANHTDEVLLARLREHDESAFAELYNRHAPVVRAIAYSKLNSTEGAQEIVQETFMDLWERRETLAIDSLPNYLAVAVRYQVINYIKKQVTVKKYHDYYKTFQKIADEETLHSIEVTTLHEALNKGLSQLPEKTQIIFRLSRFENKSIAEIAGELKLSQQAIKYHITRSLKELKLHLRDFVLSVVMLVSDFF